jgi:hypothetical protein
MEDQKPTPTAPVMDVTPPTDAAEMPASAPTVAPAAAEVPSTPAPAATTDASAAPAAPESTPEAPAPASPMAINAAAVPMKHHAPVGVVVGAIIIALVLAALTVFAFMKLNKNSDSTKAPVKQATTAAKVTSSEVQETATAIDQSISSVNDSQDFNANDLTDTTLGL